MNNSRRYQLTFAMFFLATIHTSFLITADKNVPEEQSSSVVVDSKRKSTDGALKYVPDCVRVDTWWNDRQARIAREKAALYVGEKPKALQVGYYEHGRYLQWTLDMQGVATSIMAGAGFRFLYSVATCGTEYKKFKQAAFMPGVAKSFLFWVPAAVSYQFIVNAKDHDAFVQRMTDRTQKYNALNQFGQDKID